ncbi:hypothetical protein M427DRAFT_350138 [Gonapodya prolifera JEL478]|uniref:Upf1 domain-containing protein n=1 Tax=Gonapodya prolifera (strain JEL478) TaxID=1344416 RepID=A0A139AWA9_GONPJ|nr:hypothetical protein M427DRAFT_350138 [Gonapodya prolifera JEL478]|eukprot:KXS20997.1 hypothetical protein M427DRAFT_350138 [Gonapodya prolifera JEL478]
MDFRDVASQLDDDFSYLEYRDSQSQTNANAHPFTSQGTQGTQSLAFPDLSLASQLSMQLSQPAHHLNGKMQKPTSPSRSPDRPASASSDQERDRMDAALASAASSALKFEEPDLPDDEDEYGGKGDFSAGDGKDRAEVEHACRYCGLHTPSTVAKCLTCSRWFCNARSHGSAGSHIVTHLVRSRHREVALHPDGPIGDTILECYNCGCRNVFLLGFIPAKSDTVVVLLCRQPCATLPSSHSATWDATQWLPLIQDRRFLPWLVKTPSEAETLRARKVTGQQILRLEEVWRDGGEARVEELERPGEGEEVGEVKLRYDDAFHYQTTFAPLVQLEADHDKRATESQTQEDVVVRWDKALNGKHVAFFSVPKLEQGEVKLAVGDELALKYRGELRDVWDGAGHVIKVPNSGCLLDRVAVLCGAVMPFLQMFLTRSDLSSSALTVCQRSSLCSFL